MNKNYPDDTSQCPCQSHKYYGQCCGPLLAGKSLPKTPECLMRSRYTAYVVANIPYINETMCGKALESFDPVAALEMSTQLHWLGLTIIESSEEEDSGIVSFSARYKTTDSNDEKQLIERSYFKKIGGRWLYDHGDVST